ncbi:MAG TPA: NAD(P)/FAD-dependent oxidoreductase [Acidimicrobiia bacterium]|jgi:NADH dehydrogenase|nr:NAD(P)/FAD-dependent oxidoreductase [Acidimicrobiia bacterium]
MAPMTRQRVVIVGGGFGGLACARALDGADVDVLLLDSRNYHLFTPLLYQVATALLDPSDIAYPFRTVFRRSPNVRFRQARVTGVDFDARQVDVAGGAPIAYDTLVLATGSANAYFGNPELAEQTIGMKALDEAMRLRNHVLSCLERAAQTDDAVERAAWLTFVIVGGGPTGVEYSGALAELLGMVLGQDFPELAPGSARVVLVEGADRLLGPFHPRLGAYAADALRSRGVEVRLSTLVREATATSAVLSSPGEQQDSLIGARTIVWSAGVGPSDPLSDQAMGPDGAPNGVARSRSRRLDVDEHLRLRPGVYAIGDVASVRPGGAEGELPMLSPPAMQEGRYVAKAILDGAGRARPFRYRDKGTMATIGRRAAVAQVGRVRVRGFLGWITWLVVHLYYLIGFRNRAAVLASWGWDYLRRDRPIRLIVRSGYDPVVAGLIPDEPG